MSAPDDLSATLAGIRETLPRLDRVRRQRHVISGTVVDLTLEEAVKGYSSLLAAVEAVLKLADDWDAKARKIGGQIALEDCDGATAGFKMIGYQNHRDHAAALHAAITAELAGTGKEGSDE